MIKSYGSRLILSLFILATLTQSLPRTYYSKIPPSIVPYSLQEAIVKLNTLRAYDTLYLNIDSLGGSVAELERFHEAATKRQGRLICTIEYEADSAAAMIAQMCDKIYMKPTATILFHMPRYIVSENTGEDTRKITVKIITHRAKSLEEIFAYTYAINLMRDLEVDKVLKGSKWESMLEGEDIILTAQEYADRHIKVRILE